MTTKLTVYGGVNEIGGNKILLEDNGTKILLDFGMNFQKSKNYFSEFMQPRKCNGLGDFLEFGLIPDVKGIYRSDFITHMGRKKEDLDAQGLLLSHAHADHASYINHLREDLPIYCSDETYRILKAMNDTSTAGSFNDLTDLTVCFETYTNKNQTLSRAKDNKIDRKFTTVKSKQSFKIDSLTIEPFAVDHSLSGAMGYIIHTSSGTIVYTGDFRFHGRREKETNEFLEHCVLAKPDILLIEGTRIDEQLSQTEADVEKEIQDISSRFKGLSLCNWSVRDTDRMLSFLIAAKKLNKKLAISLKQARLLEELANCPGSLAPKLDDADIIIYAAKKSWGLIGTNCDKKLRDEDYKSWERSYLDRAICYQDIRDNPDAYLFFCSNSDLKELIDIQPVKNSVYIKSVCEPFDDEMEMEWDRMLNWLNHFGLQVSQTHVSGHASGPDLRRFVKSVSPKVIVPIHTENAKAYEAWGQTTLLQQNGASIML